MRKLRPSSPEKLLFAVAQLHFEQAKTRTEIAKDLGVSAMHVSRLLREAIKRGIVRISVRAPRHEALEHRLATKFGLRDVRVVSAISDETSLRAQLGAEAARIFRDVAVEGARVGLGSGRTMYEMVKAIPEHPLAVELFPLAVIADQSTEVRSLDATTLVTTLWFKFRPAAKAMKMNLTFPAVPADALRSLFATYFDARFLTELRDYIRTANALFFSASHLRKDSQILDITDPQGVSFEDLGAKGVAGDYLFRTIDAQGQSLAVGLDDYVLGVGLETLGELATMNDKTVALVAGGPEKAIVIAAGLQAGYFNTLITDDETAARLLLKGDAAS